MLDNDIYAFLLDLFPLTDCVAQESAVLCERLQSAGIELALAANAGFPVGNILSRIDLLLRLTRDLGHVDADVHDYLFRSLQLIADEARRGGDV